MAAINSFSLEETIQIPHSFGEPKLLYQDMVRSVYQITAQFEGFQKKYYVADCGERSAVLVFDGSRILFARQYRLLVDRISLELPGGGVDANEDPIETARRECMEETGVVCKDLQLLLRYHLSLDVTKNLTSIYVSEKFDVKDASMDGQMIWIPLNECIELIFSGKIMDNMTIVSILAFYAKKNNLQNRT